jgi:hypothetical protein
MDGDIADFFAAKNSDNSGASAGGGRFAKASRAVRKAGLGA